MSEFYIEQQRNIKVAAHKDVLVVGSGPAGLGAAIAAGRMGMKTLLIEQGGSIGGMSTSGLMSHFTGTVDCPLYSEVIRRQADAEKRAPSEFINPEVLQLVYLEMLREANVEIMLYTFVADVIKENNVVKGVIAESKSGRQAIFSKRIVDGTGDGDIAAKSGVEYFMGRETDGKMQPATLMFKVGGVDYSRAVFPHSFETLVHTEKGELQSLARKMLTPPMGHVLLYPTSTSGVVTCNMTNYIDIDGTCAEKITESKIACQLQIAEIIGFLREYAPGYESCYLAETAQQMGIRETRHFIGENTITEKDITEARIFDDWIVKGAHFDFDVHNLTGAGLDETGAQAKFTQKNGYTIPYGCIIPKGAENLLLSGRNISGTHMAHSNYRAMPICMAVGYSAGIAAALSVKNDCSVRDVDVGEIQKNYMEL
jgi:hypothetical protein